MQSGNSATTAGQESGVPAASDRGLAIGLHLLASTPDCIMVLSPDGRLMSMNAAGLRLMQAASFSDLELRAWSSLWPEQSRAEVESAVAEARGGKTVRFSDFCPSLAGEARWWDVVVSPVVDGDRGVSWLLAIARDVTAQKIAEQSLRASEQRFRALADNIAQLAWMADGSGSLFWYNRRWFDYTGTSIDEMRGWGWRAVHHPDHIDRVVAKFSDHLRSGEPWEDEFPLRSAAGEYRWFLSRARPIRDEAGAVVLWCGTNTDITESREAAQRLRQSARMVELSHEAILTWSFDKGILSWNRGCEELYGYSAAEALGQTSHDLLHTKHPLPKAEIEAILRRDGRWSGQIRHRAKDGSEVWVDTRHELIDPGDATLVLETNRDVTAKRKADEMTRLLLSEVVHRVKNTLAVVQSIASQTARRSRDIGQFIAAFDARLQSLSNAHNLLTDSSWSGADLAEVISTQVAGVPGLESNIAIEGPPIFLSAQSALQLSLIFFELAANARKYGALSTSDGRVSVTWQRRSDARNIVDILWRETGGPPVAQKRERGFGTTLIERTGQQPHLSCDLRFPPEGVTCRISVEASVTSDGETRYFDPFSTAPKAVNGRTTAVPSMPPPVQSMARRRLLVVEDEPLIAMEIETVLSASGFTPLGIAGTVEDAVESIERLRPDVVVLDGSLHGAPVEGIVAKLDEHNIPFIMVTGFTPDSLPESVRARDTPIVRKPIDRAALIAGLATVARPK